MPKVPGSWSPSPSPPPSISDSESLKQLEEGRLQPNAVIDTVDHSEPREGPTGEQIHAPHPPSPERDEVRMQILQPPTDLAYGTRLSAYQVLGREVRYGNHFIRPTAIVVVDRANPRPPSPNTMKSLLPPEPKAIFEPTELEYKAVSAIEKDPPAGGLRDESYSLSKPGASVIPSLLPLKGPNESSKGGRTLVRETDYVVDLHHSIEPWMFSEHLIDFANNAPTRLNLLELNPEALREMKTTDRDRLLDMLEDYGHLAHVTFSHGDQSYQKAVGRAATLALLALIHEGKEAFATVVGTRPIPIIPELLKLTHGDIFRLSDVPLITYFALPRLNQLTIMEEALTYGALVSAVAASFKNTFGAIGDDGKKKKPDKHDPAAIYAAYERSFQSAPASMLARLEQGPEEYKAARLGQYQGVLLGGAMLYAFNIEKHDEHKRKAFEWIAKTTVDVGATGGIAMAAPALPLLAVVVPMLNHLVDMLIGPAIRKMIPDRHWYEVIGAAIDLAESDMLLEATKTGNTAEARSYITGMRATVNFASKTHSLYLKEYKEDTRLVKAADQSPLLRSMLKGLFDHRVVPKFIKTRTVGT